MNLAEKTDQRERMMAIRQVASEMFVRETTREHMDDLSACRTFMLRCFEIAEMIVDYGKEQLEPYL